VSKWMKFGAAAVAVVVAAGCGDDGSPDGGLPEAEKQELVSALSATDFGAFAAFVVGTVGEVGTLNATTVNAAINTAFDRALSMSRTSIQGAEYEGAVGIAIEYDYDVQGEAFSGWFYGVVGWNGINTTAHTIDELVAVYGFGEGGSLPTSASGTVEDGDVFAWYSTPSQDYFGLTGEASVSSSTFSGSTDCSQNTAGVACTYGTGSMNGSFEFAAETASGGAYTQSTVNFSALPAVRVIISITQ